jgi:hypothetical protein
LGWSRRFYFFSALLALPLLSSRLQGDLAAAPSAERLTASRAREQSLEHEVACVRAELRAAYLHLPLVPRPVVESEREGGLFGLLASAAPVLGPGTARLIDLAREEAEGSEAIAAAATGGRGLRILHLIANPTSEAMREVALAQTGA